MNIQTVKSPSGEEMVLLSRQDYQDLVDASNAALAMREVEAGRMPVVAEADMDAYLAAPTPLAYWRGKAGLTQVALSRAVGVTQGYLAQVEGGARVGRVGLYAKLAKALAVRIEDLLE